jgi:phosphotransferase system enzyme I (PtsI)
VICDSSTKSVIPADVDTNKTGCGFEKWIKGIPVSSGVGFGRPCFYHSQVSEHADEYENSSSDQPQLLSDAFKQLQEQLNSMVAMAENNPDNQTADIFRAHRMICEEIQTNILQTISHKGLISTNIIENCFNAYTEYFNGLTDDYLRGRADDFAELKQLLLKLLSHTEVYLTCRDYEGCRVGECELQNPHILVEDELTANVAIRIRSITKGIVAEKCGINSHAAMIARSLDIPVISGINNPSILIHSKDNILVDGDNGNLVINPDESTLLKYQKKINKPHRVYKVVDPLPEFKVLADIDLCRDIKNVIKVRADGVGIYRTEFEMLVKDAVLSEQEQFTNYQFVMDQMAGKPVYFRLFDLGSDKSAPWLDLEDEANPALGCRGARLLLAHPELLKSQARALAKVSQQSPINVIYPMISSLQQFLQLKTMFVNFIGDIENIHIHHGIMIEVPSVCENAEAMFDVVDFAKVGSSDLVQYLYAFDRTRDDFSYEELVSDQAIWNIIMHLVDIADKAGKPLGICGAIVDDPQFIPRLIDIGINTVSTYPENIAAVRRMAIKNKKERRSK